jgi:hypothetical protein
MTAIVKPHGIPGLQFRYFNQESHDWYDPLKPYTLLEYEWVRDNCKLDGETVIDAGCHHGNYAVVFAPAFVIAVDNVLANCNFAKSNMELNGMSFAVQCQTLGAEGVKTNKRPSIYKVDIEGSEFQLFPAELMRRPSVKVWIVEIHPAHGDPNDLARMFADAGFELLKVCREDMAVRPYQIGEKWKTHATLIAQRAQSAIARKV